MTIQRQALSDTVSLLYDLGTAHGRLVYNSVENFAVDILKVAGDHDLLTFTNNQQTKERAFLKEIGFSCDNIQVSVHNASERMMGHFITNDDLKKSLEGLNERLKKIKKVEKAAQDFFLSRIDNELRVGDHVFYSTSLLGFNQRLVNGDINMNDQRLVNTASVVYVITRFLPSGRVKFVLSGGHGIEYKNSQFGDGGYPAGNCYKPICTQKEYEDKVQELINATS
ncbi:MAG: hypothetical protein EKK63_10180 [Acinetobacter sp.]|uniref:hypothetical protein n=1 Tax=Acinetobacter sp. TaxID=472 RepID=UPI000F9B113D|nr:hypothetical protein [Acinetobacter sp.]RUP39356.1 MAG: hypothetical protein EKK63_10180 [Acinetobacter sp.]